MYYSFVMGINNISLGSDFTVVSNDEYYLITFPKEKVSEFEDFILGNLQNGFWNEYVGEQIVFLFKLKNGQVKKYILDASNHDEILALCCELANAKFTSIKDMILDNDFYKDKEIKWN